MYSANLFSDFFFFFFWQSLQIRFWYSDVSIHYYSFKVICPFVWSHITLFKDSSVYLEHTQNVLIISQHSPCQAILCLRQDSLILVSHCSCPVWGILGWQMNQAPLMSLWFCVFLKTFTMPGNKWIIFIAEKFNLYELNCSLQGQTGGI